MGRGRGGEGGRGGLGEGISHTLDRRRVGGQLIKAQMPKVVKAKRVHIIVDETFDFCFNTLGEIRNTKNHAILGFEVFEKVQPCWRKAKSLRNMVPSILVGIKPLESIIKCYETLY